MPYLSLLCLCRLDSSFQPPHSANKISRGQGGDTQSHTYTRVCVYGAVLWVPQKVEVNQPCACAYSKYISAVIYQCACIVAVCCRPSFVPPNNFAWFSDLPALLHATFVAIAILLCTLLALDNCCKLAFAIAIYILLASHKNVKDLFVAVHCANFPLRFYMHFHHHHRHWNGCKCALAYSCVCLCGCLLYI